MKKNNNILILDDEILAISYLKDTIEDTIKNIPNLSDYNVYGTSNQNDFWNFLEKNLPPIIFLDIEMPKRNGIEIAKEIKENSKKYGYRVDNFPIIVFTTAYENYGYKAFQVNAFDYILKPVDEDKTTALFKKINHTYEYFLNSENESITVHSSGIDIEIPLHEVLYFKADMKYIAVVTEKKEFLINSTLLQLEEKYKNFIKIHRAYLVNPFYISKFYKKEQHWFLTLKDHSIHLPVSRRQKGEIEGKINYKLIFNE